jgi:hypothetical protein
MKIPSFLEPGWDRSCDILQSDRADRSNSAIVAMLGGSWKYYERNCPLSVTLIPHGGIWDLNRSLRSGKSTATDWAVWVASDLVETRDLFRTSQYPLHSGAVSTRPPHTSQKSHFHTGRNGDLISHRQNWNMKPKPELINILWHITNPTTQVAT